MSVKVYDSTLQAFKDATAKVQSGGVWTDCEGKVKDGSEWKDVLGSAITVGTTYILGSGAHTAGTETPTAYCLNINGSYALMQSFGLYGAPINENELSSIANTYFGNLASFINNVYLPRVVSENDKRLQVYFNGAWIVNYADAVLDCMATAANNCSQCGAVTYDGYLVAWTGTRVGNGGYMVRNNKTFIGDASNRKDFHYLHAPAFTLNASGIKVENNTILIK